MDITKYKANEVYHYIKHNLRDLPLGKSEYSGSNYITCPTNGNHHSGLGVASTGKQPEIVDYQ